MLLKTIPIIFVLFWTSCLACEINQTCEVNIQDADVQLLMKGIDKFFDVLTQSSFTNDKIVGNPSFSPASIYFGLLVALIGAGPDTYTQLAGAFGLEGASQEAVVKAAQNILTGLRLWKTVENWPLQHVTVEELDIGLGVFLQKDKNFVENFVVTSDNLGVTYLKVDFTTLATLQINTWIYEHTGKGTPFVVIEQIDQAAILVLASTVFFKAQWKPMLFTENEIETGTFKSFDGTEIPVYTMTTMQPLLFYDNKEKAYAVVSLPYVADFSMLVILPYKDADLSQFIKNLNSAEYKTIIENLKETQLTTTIPIVTYTWKIDMVEYLEALGIKQLLEGVDLSAMIDGGTKEKVTSIFHGAGLYMNQYGTSVAEISSPTAKKENTQGTQNTQTAENTENTENTPPTNDSLKFIAASPFVVIIRHDLSNTVCFTTFVKTLPTIPQK